MPGRFKVAPAVLGSVEFCGVFCHEQYNDDYIADFKKTQNGTA